MFLAVWVLYAADRLLDARLLDARSPTNTLQPRHLFHHRHARIFRVFLVLSALALVPLVAALPHPLLRRYALLAALLALWLTLVHRAGGKIPPAAKEILAGLFFSAALFLPTPTTLISPLLFAVLGALDGLFITAWESRPPNQTSARNLRLAALTLILAFTAAFLRTDTPIPQAIAAAALLLVLLNRYHPRLHPTTTRAAADAALLTPLLFLWQ